MNHQHTAILEITIHNENSTLLFSMSNTNGGEREIRWRNSLIFSELSWLFNEYWWVVFALLRDFVQWSFVEKLWLVDYEILLGYNRVFVRIWISVFYIGTFWMKILNFSLLWGHFVQIFYSEINLDHLKFYNEIYQPFHIRSLSQNPTNRSSEIFIFPLQFQENRNFMENSNFIRVATYGFSLIQFRK
jgi:hypothetical protein